MDAKGNSNNNSSNDDGDKDNPYLALRRNNIQRNEAKLKELGLLIKRPRSNPKRQQGDKPTVTSSNKTSKPQNSAVVAVRRSSRRSGRPGTYRDLPNYNGVTTTTAATTTTFVDNWEPTMQPVEEEVVTPKKKRPKATTTTTVALAENSARNISLHVERLVMQNNDDDDDDDDDSGFLGKPMITTGKAAVMEESARLFSVTPLDASIYHKISFNKYCGVQEWKGNRIFLWVNLGGKNADYVNDFKDGGTQMSWFGGSRMHSESNVIVKLLDVGRAARDNTLNADASEGIVLWCRRFEPVKKTFGPYYCLGRLAYVSHDPNSHPISFVWTLLDHDRLVATNNKVVLEMMQRE